MLPLELLLFMMGWFWIGGLAGIVLVAELGVACVVAPASPGVVGAVGVVVCATARPIVPTMANALRDEMRSFDLFMEVLRGGFRNSTFR